jgi:hypothetical protein
MQACCDEVPQPQSDYLGEGIAQLDGYQRQVKDVTSNWAGSQSAQMEVYCHE